MTGTPEYLHAAVRHGHGVISQCIAGDLAVVGTGGWCKDIARTYVVWINGLAPLEGPAGEAQQRCVTGAQQTPRWQVTLGIPSARSCDLFNANLLPRTRCSLGRGQAGFLCPQRKVSQGTLRSSKYTLTQGKRQHSALGGEAMEQKESVDTACLRPPCPLSKPATEADNVGPYGI